MDDFTFEGKVVLVRVDFNSPIDPQTKRILDDTRIRMHGDATIKELSKKNAKTVVLAHQGRPGSLDFIPLKQHAEILSKKINIPVKYVDDIFGEKAQKAIKDLKNGEILVLENVRMYPNERKTLADVFVNDAFAAAHRAHASIVGFTSVLPSVAGRIMERELKALSKVIEVPEKPCVYIFGGAKADDSLKISQYVLKNNIADYILTGGVISHLFLAAKEFNLGKPNMALLEKENVMGLVPGIKELMTTYPGKIKVPVDVACEVEGKRRELTVDNLPTTHPIYDIGTETSREYGEIIRGAKTVVFSGPMGVFEKKEFMPGTKKIFEAIAISQTFSLIGGGHTVAVVQELGLAEKMSYISTAGGALIAFLMGEKLPGVESLENAATKSEA
jgi:phosphoglycerate kinase